RKTVRRRPRRRQRRPGRPRARGGSPAAGRIFRSPSMRDRLRSSILAAVALSLLSPCSRPEKPADPPAPDSSAAPKARDLTLDASQRQKIRLEKVELTSFRRTIETTGTVAFDQNR